MKKRLSLFLAAVMLLSAMGTAASAAAAPSYAGKTVVLYTGNVRGEVEVYAQVKAAADAYEAAGAEVILVDAGNYLQGSAAANTDRGLSVYNLMDAAGYDVAAMGLAELGYTDAVTGYPYHNNITRYYTQAELQDGAEPVTYKRGNSDSAASVDRPGKAPAKFQTVASNVTALKEGIYSFQTSVTVTTQSGLTVAFQGVTDPGAAALLQDGFAAVADETPAADPDADVTIVLANSAMTGECVISAPTGGELVVGALVIDNGTKAVTQEAVTLSASDEAVAKLAAEARAAADQTAGVAAVVLNGADSVNRNSESNLGDLVTDALVWYARNYIDGLDESLPLVAIQNGGNCDSFIYTGDITRTDLLRALPFSPMGIGVLYVTGAELLETIEAATQCAGCSGFAQVSGLTYTLNTGADYDGGAAYGKFYEADSINRVTITSVGGRDFDPDATYALVCDNFLISGNDTYYTLKAVREAEGAAYLNNGSGVKVRDAVALYIQTELGGTVGGVYARPQGRITVVNEPADGPKPQPQPDTPVRPAPGGTYTVAAGDSLWSIARKLLGSGSRWEELYAANRDTVKDPNRIYVGQVLTIPG